ncbi:hypothetical protein [Aliarcobacter cibarius]|jgi:hypothetical protein|uniref:Uncharacterized protein n=1 Tax=Aliarcobacter cibarius TaxID=255507 RepID=A0A5J6RH86_9BACT|nr:hypothetical protein [Aliarcobacter cibarius]QEZ89252.1 hypothetical protein ACIB15232_1135 [Aliarcobacter cibarius]QKJ27283.1 hypothetical protein ACBT_1374 [Aliarcobacter cibarius]TLT01501.1 hypothetical protein FE247_01045 [Aliarcobacter cibarius]TLT01992.1 hypothetical protein FE245_01045 [Aliarcobacter cibarius]TLT04166.1 hypothetical protein FE248_05240 [Aliarcobacter cibarius]
MERELIVTREELIKLFDDEVITDTGRAWMMQGVQVDIIALHDIEPKFLQDITKAEFYKIILKPSKSFKI